MGLLSALVKYPKHSAACFKRTSGSIAGSYQTGHESCGSSESQPINASETLIVDCITRALFLENQFIEEMNIIRNSSANQ